MNPLSYLRTSWTELTRVTWPSRPTIIRHTLLVALSIAFATLLVAIIDSGLAYLVRLLVER